MMDQIENIKVTESCRDAICRFFYYLDEWRYDDMLRLMTKDAIWIRQGETLNGQTAVRLALEKRSAKQRIRHIITNLIVDQHDEKTAFATSYLTSYKHDEARDIAGAAQISGPFRLLLIQTSFVESGGKWLISKQANVDQFHFL
jgi:hypothetical protein